MTHLSCPLCQEIEWLLDSGEAPERIATRLGKPVSVITYHRERRTPHTDRKGRKPQEQCKRGHLMAETGVRYSWQRGRSCRECKRLRDSPGWVRQTQTVAQEHQEFYQRIGEQIRTQRAANGWTQEALARATGMTRHTVSRTEDGERYLKLHEFLTLTDALGIDPKALLTL